MFMLRLFGRGSRKLVPLSEDGPSISSQQTSRRAHDKSIPCGRLIHEVLGMDSSADPDVTRLRQLLVLQEKLEQLSQPEAAAALFCTEARITRPPTPTPTIGPFQHLHAPRPRCRRCVEH